MLKAESISHAFGGASVLRHVSLQAHRGEVVGLIGPNGSGKTTLLRVLCGSLTPDQGEILFRGQDIGRLSARRLAQRMAVVVQEPVNDLMLTAAEMVLLGRTPHLGTFERRRRSDERLAAEALERVGLLHLAHREFSGLSGGEKQRLLIARAVVQEAECLLLDEPTNHLDIGYQHEVLHLVRGLGITAVVVLHDLNLAARYCDRIYLLSAGLLSAQGPAEDVLCPSVIEPAYHVTVDPVLSQDRTSQLLFRRGSSSR